MQLNELGTSSHPAKLYSDEEGIAEGVAEEAAPFLVKAKPERSKQRYLVKQSLRLASSRLGLSILALLSLVVLHSVAESRSRAQNAPTEGVGHMPTVMVTSHNDEMQAVPLVRIHSTDRSKSRRKGKLTSVMQNEALSLGVACVEVDVWIRDGELVVGHESWDLSKSRRLEDLYLKPLKQILTKNNAQQELHEQWRGIFSLAPMQDFTLMIDVVSFPGSNLAYNS